MAASCFFEWFGSGEGELKGSFHFDVGIDVDVDENFVDVDIDDHLMAGPTRQFLQQVSFVCFSDC